LAAIRAARERNREAPVVQEVSVDRAANDLLAVSCRSPNEAQQSRWINVIRSPKSRIDAECLQRLATERFLRHRVDRGVIVKWLPSPSYPALTAMRKAWPLVRPPVLPPTRDDEVDIVLRDVFLAWEEAMRWIARGWDCLEEYEHDVFVRVELQDALVVYTSRRLFVPISLRRRLRSIDRTFRHCTFVAPRPVWDRRRWPNADVKRLLGRNCSGSPMDWWFVYRWPIGMPEKKRTWYCVDPSPSFNLAARALEVRLHLVPPPFPS
jgi:hypothetical protein